jgi:Ca2+-transporting ATPase
VADPPRPTRPTPCALLNSSARKPLAPWTLTPLEVAAEFDTDLDSGLSAADAARRLAEFGPNELEQEPPRPAWRGLVDQFLDPLVALLLVAIVVSLLAWWFDGADKTPIEAIVIAAIVIANAVLGFWQERKAERAVDALRDLTASHVRVVRDARVESIASTQLARGDVVLFAEGDMVGADCRIIDSASLQIAEAALTGESVPVTKSVESVGAACDLAERTNMAYNGTAVVRGRGRGVVVATAMDTEIGRIATLLDSATEEPTPLQQQIAWLGKALGITVVVLAAVVVGAILIASPVSGAADVIDALLVGVSLAVAAVPEGLPAILSVVLALGVQRMAAQRAIVKRLSSVETLGSASVICTDKTGTLTRNEMTIVKVVTPSVEVDVTGIGYEPVGEVRVNGEPVSNDVHRREVELVLEAGSLANDATLRADGDRWEVLGDPTEAAFLVAERKLGLTDGRTARFDRVAEVPFTSERKLMTTVDLDSEAAQQPHHHDQREFVLVTKGAPDVLLARCTHERVGASVLELTAERRVEILADVERLADDALRTLAVAYRRLDAMADEVDETLERDLVHLGIVGIVDPPRPEVIDAVADAQRAGVRVIMITGDHPRTAGRIGEQLGIETGNGSVGVTGAELAALTNDEFAATVSRRSVFARVSPEQKLRIVEALQHNGQIVAMTGDGVNDAPALRQAEIGVAMGINGTEVSKEAADMILADDNFATILRAVREGREIFADIRKFLRYLLASNAGEVLVMFVGVLAAGALGLTEATGEGSGAGGLAVPLLATQILWINLLTDSALALALGVDPAVEDVMDAPPRRITDRIVDRSMIATIALIGVTTAVVGLIAFDLELAGGMLGGSGDLETARTMVFTTVVLAQIFNAFNARSDTVSAFVRPFDNRLLWAAAGLTVALQIAVVHAPPLQGAFDTEALDITRWAICIGLASAVLWVDEIRKAIQRR